MNAAHNDDAAGTIELVWSREGFDLFVLGKWPTPEQLAEMIACLMVEYRKQARNGR